MHNKIFGVPRFPILFHCCLPICWATTMRRIYSNGYWNKRFWCLQPIFFSHFARKYTCSIDLTCIISLWTVFPFIRHRTNQEYFQFSIKKINKQKFHMVEWMLLHHHHHRQRQEWNVDIVTNFNSINVLCSIDAERHSPFVYVWLTLFLSSAHKQILPKL